MDTDLYTHTTVYNCEQNTFLKEIWFINSVKILTNAYKKKKIIMFHENLILL